MIKGKYLTGAAFAAVMGTDKSQVSRWAQKGMPTRPDRMIDAVEAAAWVRRNVDSTQRERRSVGAEQERQGARTRQAEAADTFARTALWMMAREVPALVASMAIEAGLGSESAKALHALALTRAAEKADQVRRMMTLPPGELGPFTRIKLVSEPGWSLAGAWEASHRGDA